MSKNKTTLECFLEKVDKTESCWLWTGWTDKDGYGRCWVQETKSSPYAHRFAYTHFIGPIPEGLVVDHVKDRGCTNRHCVNPAHLEVVTVKENVRRALPQHKNVVKTHCPRGHLYDRQLPGGARGCRTCHNQQALARYHRQKGLS